MFEQRACQPASDAPPSDLTPPSESPKETMNSTPDQIEAALGWALELTFPASDPVALCMETQREHLAIAGQVSHAR